MQTTVVGRIADQSHLFEPRTYSKKIPWQAIWTQNMISLMEFRIVGRNALLMALLLSPEHSAAIRWKVVGKWDETLGKWPFFAEKLRVKEMRRLGFPMVSSLNPRIGPPFCFALNCRFRQTVLVFFWLSISRALSEHREHGYTVRIPHAEFSVEWDFPVKAGPFKRNVFTIYTLSCLTILW